MWSRWQTSDSPDWSGTLRSATKHVRVPSFLSNGLLPRAWPTTSSLPRATFGVSCSCFAPSLNFRYQDTCDYDMTSYYIILRSTLTATWFYNPDPFFSRRFMKWNANIKVAFLFFNPHVLTKIVLKSSTKYYCTKLHKIWPSELNQKGFSCFPA